VLHSCTCVVFSCSCSPSEWCLVPYNDLSLTLSIHFMDDFHRSIVIVIANQDSTSSRTTEESQSPKTPRFPRARGAVQKGFRHVPEKSWIVCFGIIRFICRSSVDDGLRNATTCPTHLTCKICCLGMPLKQILCASHMARVLLGSQRIEHDMKSSAVADCVRLILGERHLPFLISVVVVVTNQDSTSSRLLPGSSYNCCIHNLHAFVHKQCHPVHITTAHEIMVCALTNHTLTGVRRPRRSDGRGERRGAA
jgi:hypothetical protein